jgi:hypothetical protein
MRIKLYCLEKGEELGLYKFHANARGVYHPFERRVTSISPNPRHSAISGLCRSVFNLWEDRVRPLLIHEITLLPDLHCFRCRTSNVKFLHTTSKVWNGCSYCPIVGHTS